NQPAEGHARDDKLDALVGFGGARPVIQKKQDAGADLDGEQEQCHSAEVVPDLLCVDRYAFLGEKVTDVAQIEPFVEPAEDCRGHARDTTISASSPSPRTLTVNASRPRGGGPETTFPLKS